MDWDELVQRNVNIKSSIVARDKFETGDRKALNFGHTIGHALETYWLNKGVNVLHGEAVGAGLICEARMTLFPGLDYAKILNSVNHLCCPYLPELPQNDIPEILRLIKQDKKNSSGQNQFTLLEGIGNFSVNNFVEESIIRKTLEYYSEYTEIHDAGSTSN
jgi:3-dehydroquinate synthase